MNGVAGIGRSAITEGPAVLQGAGWYGRIVGEHELVVLKALLNQVHTEINGWHIVYLYSGNAGILTAIGRAYDHAHIVCAWRSIRMRGIPGIGCVGIAEIPFVGHGAEG